VSFLQICIGTPIGLAFIKIVLSLNLVVLVFVIKDSWEEYFLIPTGFLQSNRLFESTHFRSRGSGCLRKSAKKKRQNKASRETPVERIFDFVVFLFIFWEKFK
jgi:hypothetical protein